MQNKKKLFFDTALLTGSSFAIQCIGLSYQVWLVAQIGAAGIGLFQLVMSVSSLAVTFAISGIRFTSTRMVSEEIGLERPGGVSKTMRRCLGYSLFFGCLAANILFFGAEPIGFLWIGDARTVISLRIFAIQLPFISMSSVFAGYFTATGRVYKNVITGIIEQLTKIAMVVFFLSQVPKGDMEKACAAVCAGGSLSEIAVFGLIVALYYHDRRKHIRQGASSPKLTRRMFQVAVPLAFSAYARTSLSTLQQLLVPRGLKAAGYSADSALAGYGTIRGMAFPVIFFPSSIIGALAELIVPDLTQAQVSGKDSQIEGAANSLLSLCMLFSIGVAVLMFTFAADLGMAVYNSAEAGKYIRIFSVLIPVMYLDLITDGMLKGLGQQMHSMGINILDAAVSVFLVYTLLPKYALNGYIGVIFFTEILNLGLSLHRLFKITKIAPKIKSMIIPLVCAVGSAQGTQLILSFLNIGSAPPAHRAALGLGLAAALYFSLLTICGALNIRKNFAAPAETAAENS